MVMGKKFVFRNLKRISGLFCPDKTKSLFLKNFFPVIHPPSLFLTIHTKSIVQQAQHPIVACPATPYTEAYCVPTHTAPRDTHTIKNKQ